MSVNNNTNFGDQETDLTVISNVVSGIFQSVKSSFFLMIRFVLKHFIIIIALIAVGGGVGLYLDKTQKTYNNCVIVRTNFESSDYLYNKIDLLYSKINDNDTVFLKSIGIKAANHLSFIEVHPIIDIYGFIRATSNAENDQSLQLLKLMAEDGDMETLIKDQTTSKNYDFHIINFVTKSVLERKEILEPLLAFLDNSEYYNKAKEVYIENSNTKIEANKNMIGQIDGLLSTFAENKLGGAKSDKSVYINENSQINDLIKSKNQFVNEIGYIKKELQTHDKVIKEGSSIINVHNTRTLDTKMRVLLPVIFLFTYFLFISLFNFYKKQSSLYKDGNI